MLLAAFLTKKRLVFVDHAAAAREARAPAPEAAADARSEDASSPHGNNTQHKKNGGRARRALLEAQSSARGRSRQGAPPFAVDEWGHEV